MICAKCQTKEVVKVKNRRVFKDLCEDCRASIVRQNYLSAKSVSSKKRNSRKKEEKKSGYVEEIVTECRFCKSGDLRPAKTKHKHKYYGLCQECYNLATAESRKTALDKLAKKRVKDKDPIYLKYKSNQAMEWRKRNPEKLKLQLSKSKEKRLGYQRKYYEKNKNNPLIKVKGTIKRAIRRAIKNAGYVKDKSCFDILGRNPQEYLEHFNSFMGKPCVCGIVCNSKTIITGTNSHCDHIIPIITAKNEEDVIRLNQLDNLQIICAPCNLSKGDSITTEGKND